MTEYRREAEALGRVLWPDDGSDDTMEARVAEVCRLAAVRRHERMLAQGRPEALRGQS